MCLAVSWGMADGGIDLVKMIPRGHGGGGLVPPYLPFYLFSFAFISLHILLYLCFHLPKTLLAVFINWAFELVLIFFHFFFF